MQIGISHFAFSNPILLQLSSTEYIYVPQIFSHCSTIQQSYDTNLKRDIQSSTFTWRNSLESRCRHKLCHAACQRNGLLEEGNSRAPVTRNCYCLLKRLHRGENTSVGASKAKITARRTFYVFTGSFRARRGQVHWKESFRERYGTTGVEAQHEFLTRDHSTTSSGRRSNWWISRPCCFPNEANNGTTVSNYTMKV